MMLGTLALGRMQADALLHGTDSQARVVASHLADELLARGITDPNNAACYTFPVDSACQSADARAHATEWHERAMKALPSPEALARFDSTTGQLEVVLAWDGRASTDRQKIRMVTDVRQ
jgi:Tfp pilus assembly protein PilV